MAAELEKTEKITLNLGVVDLGEIDLLVREGFYANRTDFIRIAIRAQLATRATAVEQTNETICRVGETVKLIARRIAHDVPSLATIILPGNLGGASELRL